MDLDNYVNPETLRTAINNAIAENQNRLNVLEVMEVLDDDGSLLNFLIQKMTVLRKDFKKGSRKSSSMAKGCLVDACLQLNLPRADRIRMFEDLKMALLNAPPGASYLPSVYRLQAITIDKLFDGEVNVGAYIRYADVLDPRRKDDILCKDFQLEREELRKVAKELDRLRDRNPPSSWRRKAADFFIHPSLELRVSEERGRHYVATEDLSAGELLITEKLFAASIPSRKAFNACSGCFSSNTQPVYFPCDTCCETVFCSLECKAKACSPDGGHARECGIKDIFNQFMGVKDHGHHHLNYILLSRFDPNVFIGGQLDQVKPYHPLEYAADQQSPPADDAEQETRKLRLIKYIVSMATFPGEVKKNEFINNLIPSIGSALLWLIEHEQERKFSRAQTLQLINVCFEGVLRLKVNCFGLANNNRVFLNSTLVLFASMINHNCDENTSWEDSNGIFRFFTTKNVRQGEEILINYLGYLGDEDNFANRQMLLKHTYDILCNCRSCQVDLLATNKPFLACSACGGQACFVTAKEPACNRCFQCGQTYSPEEITTFDNSAKSLSEQCTRHVQLSNIENIGEAVQMYSVLSGEIYTEGIGYQHLLYVIGAAWALDPQLEQLLVRLLAREVARVTPRSLNEPAAQGDAKVMAFKRVYKERFSREVSKLCFWLNVLEKACNSKELAPEPRNMAKRTLLELYERFLEFADFILASNFGDANSQIRENMLPLVEVKRGQFEELKRNNRK